MVVLIFGVIWHIFIFAKYNYNYKVKEDEVGRTRGTNGGEEERV
jgi:hypothetical protein